MAPSAAAPLCQALLMQGSWAQDEHTQHWLKPPAQQHKVAHERGAHCISPSLKDTRRWGFKGAKWLQVKGEAYKSVVECMLSTQEVLGSIPQYLH